ncbi:MAG: hypothetical protein JWL59_1335 [Chthoniobacteraceae bacterium]|nr:hypothetical protein [Chthoniobacteraceae bacterium]
MGQAVNVDSKNKVSIVAPNAGKMGVVILPVTGSFSGRLLNPETNKVITFKGAILQTQRLGSGFFLDSSTSGAVVFAPK